MFFYFSWGEMERTHGGIGHHSTHLNSWDHRLHRFWIGIWTSPFLLSHKRSLNCQYGRKENTFCQAATNSSENFNMKQQEWKGAQSNPSEDSASGTLHQENPKQNFRNQKQINNRLASFQNRSLVGGFNPLEKYDRQNGNLPQEGMKIKNISNHHPDQNSMQGLMVYP